MKENAPAQVEAILREQQQKLPVLERVDMNILEAHLAEAFNGQQEFEIEGEKVDSEQLANAYRRRTQAR